MLFDGLFNFSNRSVFAINCHHIEVRSSEENINPTVHKQSCNFNDWCIGPISLAESPNKVSDTERC